MFLKKEEYDSFHQIASELKNKYRIDGKDDPKKSS